MVYDSVPQRLFDRAQATPDAPAYYVRAHGDWTPTSWGEYRDQVSQASRALIALGMEPGDVGCILGFNRPEWIILHAACMAIGAVPAGIYPTCSAEEIRYILEHTKAKFVAIESEDHWERVEEASAGDGAPDLRTVVSMRGGPAPEDTRSLGWEAFLSGGDAVDPDRVQERLAGIKADSLGTLIYTSGTTGPPKGVMLSHHNLSWTALAMQRTLDAVASDRMLSYLPLSHIAEQMFTIHAQITVGYSVYFAESVQSVPRDIKEMHPTIMFGVPRIWEKFHAGITAKLEQATGTKARLVSWARGVGERVERAATEGRKPSAWLKLQHRTAHSLVFSKLREAVGLKHGRISISGAAPLKASIIEELAHLGIPVLEVYGQSEVSGPTSFNFADDYLFGSVGKPLEGVEVKLAEDGEILVKGENVFMGYYHDAEATAGTMSDGWLLSGDLGRFDERGFLHITGRKKDIIITAGGKNVAPQNIELELKAHALIEEAVLIGDQRPYLTALITLDPDRKLADDDVAAAIQKIIDDVNDRYAKVEQIKRFTVLENSFSIDGGEMTPTLKVKRAAVTKKYQDKIEAMYA